MDKEHKKKDNRKKHESIKLAYKIIISIILIFAFALIVEQIESGSIKIFDSYIYNIVSKIFSKDSTIFFRIITVLSDKLAIISILAICFIAFKNKWYPMLLTLNAVGIIVLNQIAKIIFSRPRPLGINLINVVGYSFPSGHSMVSFTLYGYMIYLIYKNVKNIYIKLLIIISIVFVIFLIGISRIYLGVHFASDVVGGYLLSIIYLIFFTHFVKVNPKTK